MPQRSRANSAGGIIRGIPGGSSVKAATIIKDQLANVPADFKASFAQLIKVMILCLMLALRTYHQAIESEGASRAEIGVQDRAMEYFYEGGLCSHYMQERSSINKIFSFIDASENNAAAFLRTPDCY
jgi:hypothetical protein